jgi:hypothetical protein
MKNRNADRKYPDSRTCPAFFSENILNLADNYENGRN